MKTTTKAVAAILANALSDGALAMVQRELERYGATGKCTSPKTVAALADAILDRHCAKEEEVG